MIKNKIKKHVEGKKDITVTFTDEATGIIHERQVNAVFTDGVYDKAATIARVEEVGRGVAQKIASGVITNMPVSIPIDPTPTSK